MSSKIAAITRKPVATVVAALEDALALAKSGEMVGVAIVGELDGHRVYTNTDMRDNFLLLAYLEQMKFACLMSMRNNPKS